MALSLYLRALPYTRSRSFPQTNRIARYHDYIRFSTPGGTARIPLNNPKVIGVANFRGNRRHQEDFYTFSALSLDPEELRLSVKHSHGLDWDPSSLPDALARQVLFVGIYDGHGGSTVSQFLRQELHGIFESVQSSHIPDMLAWAKELGGYFKRFKGGALAPWARPGHEARQKMDLEARATLAFFEIDRLLAIESAAKECGATASVVLLQSLDNPVQPFFTSEKLSLTVAHVGDTRVLLTAVDQGKVTPMTENHHADTRIEATRLRRSMGSGLILDSFGEARWMGALENTRSLGDLKFKPFGVTPEPEVRSKLLVEGPEYSHLTLISDGVSSVVSDEEVSDLARAASTPRAAADRIVDFASEMQSQDNLTAIVIPLAGWGKITGPDRTKEFREDRLTQMIGMERLQRM